MKANSEKSVFFPLLLLLLLVIGGYWQIAFLQDTLKWDNSDAYHPYRYHVVECLRNGEFPWWNPFQFLGYPIHSDPQSGAWYPVLWLLSCFGSYSAALMNLEFILHLVVASWSAFFLCRTVGSNMPVALIGAVVYQFCGFTIETAQMLPFTISMAWLPLIFGFALRCFRYPTYGNAAGLGVTMALLITGGYPAFSIIVTYVLLGGGLLWLGKRLLARQYTLCLKLIYRIALAAGFCLVIAGGYLHALFEALPYFSRGGGLEYNETFYSYALFPSDLVGLLAPLAKKAAVDEAGNGLLYSYFGFYALLLLVLAMAIKKDRFQWLVLLTSLLCFAAAMGNELPIRKWLYEFVPGMRLFRHPIIFLGFAQLGWVIGICYAANFFLSTTQTHKRKWMLVVVIVILTFATLLLFWNSWFDSTTLSEALNVVVFGDRIHSVLSKLAIQSVVLLVSSLLLGMAIWKGKKQHMAVVLIAIIYLDGFMAVQLNRNLKITDEIKREEVDRALAELPAGFPLPNLDLKLNSMNDGMLNFSVPGKWKNLNTYAKQTAYDGYSPFILKNYDEFRKAPNYPNKLDHPLVFFSSDGQAENRQPAIIGVTDFGPNHIGLNITNNDKGWVTYFQNPFPGWNVEVDGRPAQVSSTGLMGVSTELSAGSHQLQFFYSDETSAWLFYLSMIAVIIAVWVALKEGLSSKKASIAMLLFLVGVLLCKLIFSTRNGDERLKALSSVVNQWPQSDSATLILNTVVPEKLRYFESTPSFSIRFKEASLYNHAEFIELLKNTESPYFVYVRDQLFDPMEVFPIIQTYFPKCLKAAGDNKVGAYLMAKEGGAHTRDTSWSMSFDSEHPMWNFKQYLQDTSLYFSAPGSYHMDSLADFSPTFSLHLNEENFANRVDISVKVKANTLPDSVQIVFLVEHPNGTHHTKSLHFAEMVTTTSSWHTIYWSVDLSNIAAPNDVIKCFVWKLDKSSLNLDDYCIYPSKAKHPRHELFR